MFPSQEALGCLFVSFGLFHFIYMLISLCVKQLYVVKMNVDAIRHCSVLSVCGRGFGKMKHMNRLFNFASSTLLSDFLSTSC